MGFDPLYLPAGSLRHVVVIQKSSTSRDAAGQTSAAWTQVCRCRASITGTGSASYKASFSENALASESTDLVTVRWPGLSVVIEPGMRILHGNDIYRIEAVDNIEHRNRILRLACKTVDEDSI